MSPSSYMPPRRVFLVGALAAVAACGPRDDGLAAASATGAPSPASSASASAKVAAPVALDPALPPTQCSIAAAESAHGTAHFERPTGSSAKDEWTLVLSLAPGSTASYDAARTPVVYGSVEAPSASMEGRRIVVRARVRFTSDAYATFVVGLRCANETGLLSAGVRWTDGDMEPGKTLEALLSPFGGS